MAENGVMKFIIDAASFSSNLLTIAASSIAIYLFITKRKEISSVFSLLVNYTFQMSLSEIKEKLERLNDYNAKDQESCEIIENIFHEIIGQIRGNDKLNGHFAELVVRMEELTSNRKKLTEPKKRAVVSELRERLRNLNVASIDNLIGEENS
ncbi:hypothetical protein [Pseudomonas plecoglossicida]|uniref:hypothetical protein n=1 Tax=Pseudomonas plecoglossicida TaxID=70775 RepID=UPI00200AE956|nr:hypothetical protein [Pseudomonas plecoglossicida]GLR34712.1 hypothetical protein GCM10011247_01090 [Pseudomonas plecoglossicida]